MLTYVIMMPPRDRDQVPNTWIWWPPKIQGIGYGFYGNIATQVDKNGLIYIWNIWGFENNQLYQEPEIAQKSKLNQREIRAIETMPNSIPNKWKRACPTQPLSAPIGN